MKYNAIMEKIEVTDEMKERILNNISQNAPQKKKKVIPFPYWKMLGSFAACVAIVLLCATVFPNIVNRNRAENSKPEDSDVAVVNGIIECEDINELSQEAGFEISELTNIPFDILSIEYTWWFGTTAQIEYRGDQNNIIYRVEKGKEDISGDYNYYLQVQEEMIYNNIVTIKGNEEKVFLAIWSDDNYSYSIAADEGVSISEMKLIIESLPGK